MQGLCLRASTSLGRARLPGALQRSRCVPATQTHPSLAPRPHTHMPHARAVAGQPSTPSPPCSPTPRSGFLIIFLLLVEVAGARACARVCSRAWVRAWRCVVSCVRACVRGAVWCADGAVLVRVRAPCFHLQAHAAVGAAAARRRRPFPRHPYLRRPSAARRSARAARYPPRHPRPAAAAASRPTAAAAPDPLPADQPPPARCRPPRRQPSRRRPSRVAPPLARARSTYLQLTYLLTYLLTCSLTHTRGCARVQVHRSAARRRLGGGGSAAATRRLGGGSAATARPGQRAGGRIRPHGCVTNIIGCGHQYVHHFCDGFKTLSGYNSITKMIHNKNSSAIDRAAAARSKSDEFFEVRVAVHSLWPIKVRNPSQK